MRTLEVATGPSRLWVGIIVAALAMVLVMVSVIVPSRSSASSPASERATPLDL